MPIPKIRVKTCGLTTAADVAAAAAANVAYVGFVFFPKSPRHVGIAQARALALEVPAGIAKVALVVNPSDAQLHEILDQVPIDIIQLHGAETPARVAEVKALTGLPVMKAVGIATAGDIARAQEFAAVADQLLLDAKPDPKAELPGGNGLSFDWTLLQGLDLSAPWMLAGGLTPDNVAEAVARTGATQVDVSSGIEEAPGQKSARLIQEFATAAQAV